MVDGLLFREPRWDGLLSTGWILDAIIAVVECQSFGSDRPSPVSDAQVKQLAPSALAYLGDAVYELFVRDQFLLPPSRLSQYHQRVVSQVRAETQAAHATTLLPHLTAIERSVFNRGRNAASAGPKRIDPTLYQQASGLEALIGYLYLTNPQRLQELLHSLDFNRFSPPH